MDPNLEVLDQTLSDITSLDFQPLIDFLHPYLVIIVFLIGIVIALLIVNLYAKGWQSNAR